MHFEARLVQSIGHYGKDILNERQKILLVERLSNTRRFTDVQQQFVQNLKTLYET